MLERIRRHIRGNVVGYLALFVALSGTAVASGVLNKKKVNKIITNRAPGLSVARAKSADNASLLGGQGPGAFQQRVRWAIVDSAGNIAAQSGGIVNDLHNPGPAGGCPCDALNFGSSQVNKAIIVTPNTEDRIANATLCGGTSNPGGVVCTNSVNDTNHIIVMFKNDAGTAVGATYYVAVIG